MRIVASSIEFLLQYSAIVFYMRLPWGEIRMKTKIALFTCILVTIAGHFIFAEPPPSYQSEYVGQEMREIKSLSEEDIKELQAGEGWGLAKAAELNGFPGPFHLLEMKHEIGLTKVQTEKIEAFHGEMKKHAIPLGKKLIEAESSLDRAFATRKIDEKTLGELLDNIALIRNRLRYVHLSAHLKTPAVLSREQMKLYNKLRGYSSSEDPCDKIPAGHDPELWKRHHNCP
jgi:Spy/CpxP family protein refolding chaperone